MCPAVVYQGVPLSTAGQPCAGEGPAAFRARAPPPSARPGEQEGSAIPVSGRSAPGFGLPGERRHLIHEFGELVERCELSSPPCPY
jgi:hypothetical protein